MIPPSVSFLRDPYTFQAPGTREGRTHLREAQVWEQGSGCWEGCESPDGIQRVWMRNAWMNIKGPCSQNQRWRLMVVKCMEGPSVRRKEREGREDMDYVCLISNWHTLMMSSCCLPSPTLLKDAPLLQTPAPWESGVRPPRGRPFKLWQHMARSRTLPRLPCHDLLLTLCLPAPPTSSGTMTSLPLNPWHHQIEIQQWDLP